MTNTLPAPAVRRTQRSTLSVCVAGAGAIGQAVADALSTNRVPGATLTAVLTSRSSTDDVDRAIDASDVIVEATTVAAARSLVPRVTRRGKDIVVCSSGVLAEYDTADDLRGGTGRVLLPTGALGGFDILSAAARAGTCDARVRHTTIKRPSALGVDEPLTAPREIFTGSAREAALAFPRTSNSSVALALATIGLDRVEVVVVADPDATNTRHIVEWNSPVGNYELTFINAVDPTSGGRTSAITAWSVTAVVAALLQGVGSGAVVLDSNLSPVAG